MEGRIPDTSLTIPLMLKCSLSTNTSLFPQPQAPSQQWPLIPWECLQCFAKYQIINHGIS